MLLVELLLLLLLLAQCYVFKNDENILQGIYCQIQNSLNFRVVYMKPNKCYGLLIHYRKKESYRSLNYIFKG